MATNWNNSSIKNLTPKQISVICAGILTSFFIITFITLSYLELLTTPWYLFFVLVPLSFVVAYFIFQYAINTFIYRRIKLIYKNIHRFKRQNAQLTVQDMTDNVLDDVQRDVVNWTNAQSKEIKQLKRMEEYRRNFIGDLSHELKTPIFNIQGYIHTLIDGGLYDENINKKYLERAAKNLSRLLDIVEDLDAIAKLESGILKMDFQHFNIVALVQEIFEELRLQYADASVELALKEGMKRPFFVYADKEAIRQVLNNLLINSIKYGGPNSQTKIGFYDMDKNILVEVADNGPGIEEKHLKHLFDRFYRVEKSRSRNVGGSGLGLSIVKHIIEAHSQTVNVRSTVGIGSTFGFTLTKGKG